MTTPDVDRLRRVPLFADLDGAALQRVAELATEFEAPSGHVLMERGQAGTGVFIIEEGSVRVELPHDDDVTLGPGEFVGELSVLADTPRSARVCVHEDLRALAIRRGDLDALLEREPPIALAMLRGVARRFAGHL
ncbi:MAG TPA: Crp/Fnr family transcriptional regulator [Acidimicrobiia bacterium]|nr:Crp/Fnr family transcriptional regulator [Acidimicrobiia bacterium]